MAQRIARDNNLSLEVARRYASLIGDTPDVADDGRVIVRKKDDTEIARIMFPTNESSSA